MGIAYNPSINFEGLSLCLDAANPKSYPGSGSTWYDLSGNNNHCTLFNSPSFVSDLSGGFNFDGANTYGTFVPNNINLDANFTISILFNPFSNLTSSSDSRHSLFSGANCGDFGLEIGAFNGGCGAPSTDGRRFLMHRQCNCFSNISTTFAYEVNQPILFTFTRSPGRAGYMYLNGLPLSSSFDTTSFGYTSPPLVYIGRRGNSQSQRFNGNIHAIYVHNRQLSNIEIRKNYEALKTRFGL